MHNKDDIYRFCCLSKKFMAKRFKILNLLLLISFIVTVMVPITGIHIHKMSSAIFLFLCMIHAITYRKKMKTKSILLLTVIFLSFFSGIFSMIFEQYAVILQIHKAISIGVVFFLAIHIFIFHKKFSK